MRIKMRIIKLEKPWKENNSEHMSLEKSIHSWRVWRVTKTAREPFFKVEKEEYVAKEQYLHKKPKNVTFEDQSFLSLDKYAR